MTDFVLIHGTTMSPTGWGRLVGILEAVGHHCWVMDLESSPDRDVDDYARVIVEQARGAERPIVVAHSGSGVLLPAAARALDAQHQVWLAAFVPDGKRALLDELQADPGVVFNQEWVGADPTQDPVLATYFLFHDCDLETLRWGLGTVRAFIPQLPYRQPVELALEIPSTYVLCSQDRTIRAEWARREADRRLGVRPIEIDAGHCPHAGRPARIAEILDTL